jgi:hypothetical protein
VVVGFAPAAVGLPDITSTGKAAAAAAEAAGAVDDDRILSPEGG